MKLLTFMKDGRKVLGVKVEQGVIDDEAALQKHPAANVPGEVMEVITQGDIAIKALGTLVRNVVEADDQASILDEAELEWAPCVTKPSKILCVGLNYKKH